MKLKTVIFTVLLCISVIAASGCNMADLGADSLIRPPKTIGDEAEIEQLITKTVSGDYTLKYPKSGNYRSAIVMIDLDKDGSDEAVAFYRTPDSKAKINMLVMYRADDEWRLSENCETEAADVDCVDFADINGDGRLEILSGYTTYNTNINRLACNSYSDGRTDSITVERSYSSFICADFDSDGIDEVMLLSLFTTDNEATAAMLDYSPEKNCLYPKAAVAMDPNVVRYSSINAASFEDSTQGLIVDGAFSDDELNTQIIFYSKELSVLRNPLYKEKEKNVTQRSVSLPSSDINNDGRIEIPVVTPLPDSSEISDEKAGKLSWNTFYPESEILALVKDSVANFEYNYSIAITEKWDNASVTAVPDSDNASMTFYVWNNNKLTDRLFSIRVFELSVWDLGESSSGCTLITKDENYAYAFSDLNSDSEFSLSEDEIKTAFSKLPENSA